MKHKDGVLAKKFIERVLGQQFLDKCFEDLSACERKGDVYWLDAKNYPEFNGMTLKYKSSRERRRKTKIQP